MDVLKEVVQGKKMIRDWNDIQLLRFQVLSVPVSPVELSCCSVEPTYVELTYVVFSAKVGWIWLHFDLWSKTDTSVTRLNSKFPNTQPIKNPHNKTSIYFTHFWASTTHHHETSQAGLLILSEITLRVVIVLAAQQF